MEIQASQEVSSARIQDECAFARRFEDYDMYKKVSLPIQFRLFQDYMYDTYKILIGPVVLDSVTRRESIDG